MIINSRKEVERVNYLSLPEYEPWKDKMSVAKRCSGKFQRIIKDEENMEQDEIPSNK